MLIPADCLILIAALLIIQLPIKMPRLPRPFAARRAAHNARVKARAAKRADAAAYDEFCARELMRLEFNNRYAALVAPPAEPTEVEEFYAQL